MPNKRFAIIDIETTGGKPGPDRITEIAIVLYDGQEVIDSFESLINPERSIPHNITQMTGISNEMVAGAPKFYEVAKQVVEMTQGAIFVAHNVGFDYNFIKYEFQQLGFSFRRRKLCTVRLSRKVFPGLRSYSLGNLIKHFDISVTDRHRAMADTLATVELLKKASPKTKKTPAKAWSISASVLPAFLQISPSTNSTNSPKPAASIIFTTKTAMSYMSVKV